MKASCTQKLWEQVGTCGIPVSMRFSAVPTGEKVVGTGGNKTNPPAVRAIALDGIVGEAAYWLGWDNPRLTPDRLTESIRAGRVTVSPGDLLRAAGWQLEDMARAFGIVRNAWAWIVAKVEERARQAHGWLFVPTVPTRGRACGNTESLVPQGMPHVPTVPTEKQGEVK